MNAAPIWASGRRARPLESFFLSPFFPSSLFFFILHNRRSVQRVYVQMCGWVSYLPSWRCRRVLAGIAPVPDSQNQPEEFRHAAERIDCSASVERVRYDFERAAVHFALCRKCWFVFRRECAHLIMKRCLQTGSEGETQTGLARDWKINACQFAGRRGKSCNQSLESRL